MSNDFRVFLHKRDSGGRHWPWTSLTLALHLSWLSNQILKLYPKLCMKHSHKSKCILSHSKMLLLERFYDFTPECSCLLLLSCWLPLKTPDKHFLQGHTPSAKQHCFMSAWFAHAEKGLNTACLFKIQKR